jgi:hypothetical protein
VVAASMTQRRDLHRELALPDYLHVALSSDSLQTIAPARSAKAHDRATARRALGLIYCANTGNSSALLSVLDRTAALNLETKRLLASIAHKDAGS